MAKKININFITLVVLFMIWLLPFLQGSFSFVKIEALGGISTNEAQDTTLNSENWFSGRYADLEQDYLTYNFGFRETAIRLQNQIQYELFSKTNAEDVIVGKNNYLFELKYIKAHYGFDFIGEAYLSDKLMKMKFIQDTLAKLNKTFIFIIAPSKADFFPEYIPDKYKTDSTKTNYNEIKSLIKNYDINYIDYNAMFSRLKTTSKYDLYPYAGTHWSEYGNIVALDSLKHYIELHTKYVLPNMDYSEIKLSDGYGGTDNDMGKAINLLFLPNYGELAYPNVKFTETKNTNKPNLLMVSDSYWMSIYYSHRPNQLFKKHSFWYYYNVSYDYGQETEGKSPCDLNLREEVLKKDIICVMCTAPNLKSIGSRFVDDCYDLFKKGMVNDDYRKRMAKIEKNRMQFWNDDEACQKFLKNAISEKRPLDSVITGVAKYLVDSSN